MGGARAHAQASRLDGLDPAQAGKAQQPRPAEGRRAVEPELHAVAALDRRDRARLPPPQQRDEQEEPGGHDGHLRKEEAERALRDEPADAPFNVYAFEDLVAYHLWFASQGAAHRARSNVAVVKNVPGLSEDPAYFLPRRFAGVAVRQPSALDGERLWLAFRDNSLDEGRPPLNILKGRGYRVERVFETSAQGQRAFLVLVSREGGARPSVTGSD